MQPREIEGGPEANLEATNNKPGGQVETIVAEPADSVGPHRVRQSRAPGWRKPPNARAVHRSTRFGNPFDWRDEAGTPEQARAAAVARFEAMLADPVLRAALGYPTDAEIRSELAGLPLMCWCPLDGPCHADVLLRAANGGDVQ